MDKPYVTWHNAHGQIFRKRSQWVMCTFTAIDEAFLFYLI